MFYREINFQEELKGYFFCLLIMLISLPSFVYVYNTVKNLGTKSEPVSYLKPHYKLNFIEQNNESVIIVSIPEH